VANEKSLVTAQVAQIVVESTKRPELPRIASEVVLKMGGAGDSPAPVGDPPTGTALSHVAKRPFSVPRTVASVPSGGSPVLPGNYFSNRHTVVSRSKLPGWQSVKDGRCLASACGVKRKRKCV